MARHRGFLAEVQHQSRLADQRRRATVQQHIAAQRRSEQALRAAERASAVTALTEIPQFCSPNLPTSGRFRE